MPLIGGGSEKLRTGPCSNGEERESGEVEGTSGGRASLPSLEPAVRASQGVAGGGGGKNDFSRSTDKHVQASDGLKQRREMQRPCEKERREGGRSGSIHQKVVVGASEKTKGTELRVLRNGPPPLGSRLHCIYFSTRFSFSTCCDSIVLLARNK